MSALMSAPSNGKVNQAQKYSLNKCVEWEESKGGVLKVLTVDETSS